MPFHDHPSARYNPPSEHRTFHLANKTSTSDAIAHIKRELALDDAAFANVIAHGGFYLDKTRILDIAALGTHLQTGSVIHLYRFLREPEAIPLSATDILWHERGVIAVNKPAWLPTQGTRVSLRYSLENALRTFTGIPTLTAIHRLDRQTSGVVLFGETARITGDWMKRFAARTIDKHYLAIVSPTRENKTVGEKTLASKQWTVSGYLARDARRLPQDYFCLVDPRIDITGVSINPPYPPLSGGDMSERVTEEALSRLVAEGGIATRVPGEIRSSTPRAESKPSQQVAEADLSRLVSEGGIAISSTDEAAQTPCSLFSTQHDLSTPHATPLLPTHLNQISRLNGAKDHTGSKWSESHFCYDGNTALGPRILCKPITGRTHQLRVHLAACGLPIVGDTLYGDHRSDAPRLMLHAYRIAFRDNDSKTERVIEAPVPLAFAPLISP